MNEARGISEENRARLESLHRALRGPFSVLDAAGAWRVARPRARRLLAQLTEQGWLTRVRRDTYVTVPLGATMPGDWRADPWVVAAAVFDPCYVAGWSACEHWGLTEQIFRDVWVVTSRRVSPHVQEIQSTTFNIKVTRPDRLFGLSTVWRDGTKVLVSDPSRTVVDLLDDPRIGGGMRHVAEVVGEYFSGEHRRDHELIEDAGRLGNGAVFKRLGYLLELLNIEAGEVVAACGERLTAGVSMLDPTGPDGGRTTRRWRLRLNVVLSGGGE
jgi:predicted transcriptional regulator of viral defense system